MSREKIIFIGTPEFGAIILEKLVKSSQKPFLVITEPDKPVGRKQVITPPPVKQLAEKYNIAVVQPEKIENCRQDIENLKPDLGIVAAYGQILPKNILNIAKYGFINVHPSLLPHWRGSSPIQYAILKDDQKTGVTIMRMSEKLDAGPILAQKEIEIGPMETFLSLRDRLAELGAGLLIETLPKLLAGKMPPQPQDETKATYTKILKREDGKIDWRKPAESIDRQVRAFSVWPNSYALWPKNSKETKIKILKSRVLISPDHVRYPIGKVLVVPQNEIGVQCGDGNFLVIEKLQLEGKKETLAEDFLRGNSDFIGAILE